MVLCASSVSLSLSLSLYGPFYPFLSFDYIIMKELVSRLVMMDTVGGLSCGQHHRRSPFGRLLLPVFLGSI